MVLTDAERLISFVHMVSWLPLFLLTGRGVGWRKMREREQEGTKYAVMRGIVLGHSVS